MSRMDTGNQGNGGGGSGRFGSAGWSGSSQSRQSGSGSGQGSVTASTPIKRRSNMSTTVAKRHRNGNRASEIVCAAGKAAPSPGDRGRAWD